MRHLTIAIVLLSLAPPAVGGQDEVDISPDGRWVAFTVVSERMPEDPVGPVYRALYVASTRSDRIRPFINGKVDVSSPRFSPDGRSIAFLTKRVKDAKTQAWQIPIDGGEAVQLTNSASDVLFFRWHPTGKMIAYLATVGESKKEKLLKEKGYDFVFYEENLKHRNVYVQKLAPTGQNNPAVWDFAFSPYGDRLAASVSPKNLIDHSYMFRDIYLIDIKTKSHERLVDISGKLGNYAFNPKSTHLAYTAAHVEWIGWIDPGGPESHRSK